MSEQTGPSGEDKETRVRRKPQQESILTPTFAASRQTVGNRFDEQHQPGRGFLQRQCACGTHTIGGGECDRCRQKREANFLPQAAVKHLSEEVGALSPAGVQTFPELSFAHDLSRVPVHTTGTQQQKPAGETAKLGAVENISVRSMIDSSGVIQADRPKEPHFEPVPERPKDPEEERKIEKANKAIMGAKLKLGSAQNLLRGRPVYTQIAHQLDMLRDHDLPVMEATCSKIKVEAFERQIDIAQRIASVPVGEELSFARNRVNRVRRLLFGKTTSRVYKMLVTTRWAMRKKRFSRAIAKLKRINSELPTSSPPARFDISKARESINEAIGALRICRNSRRNRAPTLRRYLSKARTMLNLIFSERNR